MCHPWFIHSTKEAKLLDAHFKTGGHFQRLLRFAQRGHDPEWFRQFVDLERKATMIKTFQVLAVPGLLQTPEYAFAVIQTGLAPDPEQRMEERMKRQAILEDAPRPKAVGLNE